MRPTEKLYKGRDIDGNLVEKSLPEWEHYRAITEGVTISCNAMYYRIRGSTGDWDEISATGAHSNETRADYEQRIADSQGKMSIYQGYRQFVHETPAIWNKDAKKTRH